MIRKMFKPAPRLFLKPECRYVFDGEFLDTPYEKDNIEKYRIKRKFFDFRSHEKPTK
jgi:hypothetical protein